MTQDRPANLPLDNIRWERFARWLADGEKQCKAYVDAGFAANSGRASRLANDAAIVRRVAYLLQEKAEIEQKSTEEAIKAAGITKQMILDELWDNAQKAKAAVRVLDKKGEPTGHFKANWAASNQALHLLGKELGMFRDRPEKDTETPNPWEEILEWVAQHNKPLVAVQVNNGQPALALPRVRG